MGEPSIRVLIIEDEAEIRELLLGQFHEFGIVAEALENGKNVLAKLESFQPDVILLDQLMPGKSGQEVVKEIRGHATFTRVPIMMVTGLNSEEEKVRALEIGADDYVTKPFSIREVVARAQALVRRARTANPGSSPKNIVAADLNVDLGAHRVFLQGREVQLTLTEFRILVELLKQPGLVLSRDKLREKALGNLNVTDRTIDVHMASLRKKLEHMGDKIETVRGVGYRIDS